jgi:hypothetical protein
MCRLLYQPLFGGFTKSTTAKTDLTLSIPIGAQPVLKCPHQRYHLGSELVLRERLQILCEHQAFEFVVNGCARLPSLCCPAQPRILVAGRHAVDDCITLEIVVVTQRILAADNIEKMV